MARTVFFDLDGVIANFVGGALLAHGRALPIMQVTWDFWKKVGLTDEQFWLPLANSDFWAGLKKLPDGSALLRSVTPSVGRERIGFLTSGICEGSFDGKRRWLREHVAPDADRHIICAHSKYLVAAPDKLLVDDFDGNVTPFREAGGKALLIPRPWNSRRSEVDPATGLFRAEQLYQEFVALYATLP